MALTLAGENGIDPDRGGSAGPDRAARTLLVAVAVFPVLLAAIRAIGRGFVPVGDSALLYLRTADVLTRHHPFLGSWTSASNSVGVDMNNPGPTYDFLIAPFAHLLPPGPGAALGVGAVNVASILLISRASRRIGGWQMQRWMLAAAAALAWSMGSELLIDTFQAHALLLPFLLFLVLLVGLSSGMASLLPGAVAVGSLLVQTHISFAYILLLLVLSSAVTLLCSRRVRPRQLVAAARSRPVMHSGIVFVLLWAHPFWEELFGSGRGNLSRLATNSSGGPVSVGLVDAIRISASVMTVPQWWLRSEFGTKIRYEDGNLVSLPGLVVATTTLVVVVVVLTALTVAAHRRGLRVQMAVGALATVSVPATVVSLSRLTIGPTLLSSGHVRWVWVLAVFITCAVLWLVFDLRAARRVYPHHPYVTPIAVSLVIVFSVLNLAYHPDGMQDVQGEYEAIPALRRAFNELDVLADHDPVLFETGNLRFGEPHSSAMMMWMTHLGIEFRVEDDILARQLGPARMADGSERTTVFQLEGAYALSYKGPACTISLTSALEKEEELRAERAALDLAGAMTDGTIRFDASRLTNLPPLENLALGQAIGGDVELGFEFVVFGTLSAWIADGVASSSNRAATEERLELVAEWVDHAYGFFADGIDPCPAADRGTPGR